MWKLTRQLLGSIDPRVDDKGFLWFRGIGGWLAEVLLSQRVEVLTRDGRVPGVIGKKRSSFKRDKDDECDGRSGGIRRYQRNIGRDRPFSAQALEPPLASRRRQSHFLRQLLRRQKIVVLHYVQQHDVEMVELRTDIAALHFTLQALFTLEQ